MKKDEVGAVGEKVAANYLIAQGFEVLDLNYFNNRGYRIGEIDIIAKDSNSKEFVFVEVKTRIGQKNSVVPEENINKTKIECLQKAVNWFFKGQKIFDANWRIDAISVIIDLKQKKFHLKHMKYIRF